MLKRIDARIPEELLNDIREAAKDEGVTVTDIMIECFRLYLTAKKEEINDREAGESQKPPCQSVPDVKIMPVTSPGEVEKSIDKPDIAIDTIYEPDPFRQPKYTKTKQSVSKAVQPVVKAMLSGIVKQPTVSHHPQCRCGICCPG